LSVVPSPIIERHSVSQFSIARELDLSQSTVSNALNGKRHLCSRTIYARIWSHALKVGYRGCGFSREAMPGNGLRQVGVVLGDGISGANPSPFLASVRWALEDRLARRGIVTLSLGSSERFHSTLLSPVAPGTAPKLGLVVLGRVSVEFLQELSACAHRLVTVGAFYPSLAPAVLTADAQAASLLLAHLKTRGHTSFTWFGDSGEPASSTQIEALSNAAIAQNVLLQPGCAMCVAKPGRTAGRECATAFQRRAATGAGPIPTAVICSDARVARGALDELVRLGFSIPGDVSVATLDTTPDRMEEDPEITAAASDPEKIGIAAAELLLSYPRARRGVFRPTLVPATLAPGATTGRVPARRWPARTTVGRAA
jgi:DNA-binding LacI/PurR family transcriptional regulator